MLQIKGGERNLSRVFGRFSFAIILSPVLLYAGAFERFQAIQTQSFVKFTNKKDKEFQSYLQQQWSAYKVFAGVKGYKFTKPNNVPLTKPIKTVGVGPRILIKLKPMPVKKSLNLVVSQGNVVVDFFGSALGFSISKEILKANFLPRTQEGVSNFFTAVASSQYTGVVARLKEYSKEFELNDWGIYLLVNKLSKKIFTNPDNRALFSWFLLNKLHFDVRVGISDKHIVLLSHSKKVIYSTPSYFIDKKRYYALSDYNKVELGTLKTYGNSYPLATKAIDLSLKVLPKFKDDKKQKKLHFDYENHQYTFQFDYNKNLIDFMATYPQANYSTYFDAPMQSSVYHQIASQMVSYINGKRASDAMNFVLAFVQHAFRYETDMKQFGREKSMFAEETLYYPGSDCEDRAVLYAYLMKQIFHIPVVAVKYKNHMTTALDIPMKGYSFRVNGYRYVVADPTYINANIGQSMPQYIGVQPQRFIPVKIQ